MRACESAPAPALYFLLCLFFFFNRGFQDTYAVLQTAALFEIGDRLVLGITAYSQCFYLSKDGAWGEGKGGWRLKQDEGLQGGRGEQEGSTRPTRGLCSADRACGGESRLIAVPNVSEQFKSWKVVLMEVCVLLLRERVESDQQIAQLPARALKILAPEDPITAAALLD